MSSLLRSRIDFPFSRAMPYSVTTLCPNVRGDVITLPGGSNGQLLPNDEHDGFFYALLHKQRTENR